MKCRTRSIGRSARSSDACAAGGAMAPAAFAVVAVRSGQRLRATALHFQATQPVATPGPLATWHQAFVLQTQSRQLFGFVGFALHAACAEACVGSSAAPSAAARESARMRMMCP